MAAFMDMRSVLSKYEMLRRHLRVAKLPSPRHGISVNIPSITGNSPPGFATRRVPVTTIRYPCEQNCWKWNRLSLSPQCQWQCFSSVNQNRYKLSSFSNPSVRLFHDDSTKNESSLERGITWKDKNAGYDIEIMRAKLRNKYKLDETKLRTCHNDMNSTETQNKEVPDDYVHQSHGRSFRNRNRHFDSSLLYSNDKPESTSIDHDDTVIGNDLVPPEHLENYERLRDVEKISTDSEKISETWFGVVRLDNQNEPNYLPSRRKKNNKKVEEKLNTPTRDEISLSNFQGQETVRSVVDEKKMRSQHNDPVMNEYKTQNNFFDEHYFPNVSSQVGDSSTGQAQMPEHLNETLQGTTRIVSGGPKEEIGSQKEAYKYKQDAQMNLFDEQYFEQADEIVNHKVNTERVSGNLSRNDSSKGQVNFFDEQYFPHTTPPSSETEISQDKSTISQLQDDLEINHQELASRQQANVFEGPNFPSAVKSSSKKKYIIKEEVGEIQNNFFDEQYFPSSAGVPNNGINEMNHEGVIKDPSDIVGKHLPTNTEMRKIDRVESSSERHTGSVAPEVDVVHTNSVSEKVPEPITNEDAEGRPISQARGVKVAADLENPQTAYDLAMKIRLTNQGKIQEQETDERKVPLKSLSDWKGKVDSRGYRILSEQVRQLDFLPEDDVVAILKDSIVYEDENVIAIDKPYGLASHGGPGTHHSVGKLLRKFATRIDTSGKLETLHLIHRLDKETTGIMLLAKSKHIAWKVHGIFKRREVTKRYWMLTKGIPNPVEGVIDIPMREQKIGSFTKMSLSPHYTPETKLIYRKAQKTEKYDAITHYKVLDANHKAALVQCEPSTGVKHQIRCHMALALSTPILGDHKYSHAYKLAPQKLHPEILQRLGIRQAKVRHLAMHLHARELIIPEFMDGKNLFLRAALPKHFVQNMKWLKIKPPK